MEFAITAPVLVLLALGAADYGTLVNQQAMLEAATRAGAEYARMNPSDASSTPAWNNTKNQVTSFTNTFSPAPTASVTTVCTCVDDTTVTCPGTCTGKTNPVTGLTDTRVINYVKVTATQNFTPLLSYASFALPASLSAQTLVRTQ